MNLISNLKQQTANCIHQLYGVQIQADQVLVNATKPEFEGDYTIVLFAFVKQLGKSPEVLGNELGAAMLKAIPGVLTQFNIVKGFLNFSISNALKPSKMQMPIIYCQQIIVRVKLWWSTPPLIPTNHYTLVI